MTKLIHGDCIEEMAKMDAGSVDLTVTSPPYDNLRTYEGSLQWNEDIWKQVLEGLYRVTKDGGVVVWVVGDATINGSETGTSFKQALYAMECGFNLHDTMIWKKDGGGAVGSNKCYIQNFEYMFVFSKGKIKTVNRIKDVPNGSFGKDKSGVGRRTKDGLHKIEKRKPCSEFKVRNNHWYIPPQKGKHPAVFPDQLAHDHIISWSNEGDTVFDPFLGSGTTGKMAKQLNRNFIGIEKVEKYYDIAKERIPH
jgi:DNA modification methylase